MAQLLTKVLDAQACLLLSLIMVLYEGLVQYCGANDARQAIVAAISGRAEYPGEQLAMYSTTSTCITKLSFTQLNNTDRTQLTIGHARLNNVRLSSFSPQFDHVDCNLEIHITDKYRFYYWYSSAKYSFYSYTDRL